MFPHLEPERSEQGQHITGLQSLSVDMKRALHSLLFNLKLTASSCQLQANATASARRLKRGSSNRENTEID